MNNPLIKLLLIGLLMMLLVAPFAGLAPLMLLLLGLGFAGLFGHWSKLFLRLMLRSQIKVRR